MVRNQIIAAKIVVSIMKYYESFQKKFEFCKLILVLIEEHKIVSRNFKSINLL